jgi:MFS family permease
LSATNVAYDAVELQVTCPDYFKNSKLLDCKTFVSSTSVVGITIGSILGGVFVGNGRRINVIIFNLVIIIGSILSVNSNWWILNIGRLVFGFASGVLLCATPKIIEETIPTHL